jgi:hypothetical protein
MALRLVCRCGYVIEGDDDEALWRNAQDHMGVLHPELVERDPRGPARPGRAGLAAGPLEQPPVDVL